MQLALIIPIGGSGLFPDNALPGIPGIPSQGPGFPTQLPMPGSPGVPTPPIHLPPPVVGGGPIYPADPSHPIALPPGSVWPPLGPGLPQGKVLALVAISGYGYRWTVIDTSLSAGMPLPGGPPTHPVNPIAPGAEPKR